MRFKSINIPESLKDSFYAHLEKEMIQSTRFFSALGCILFISSAFIDHIAIPTIMDETEQIRIVCVSVLGLIFLSTFSKVFISYCKVIQHLTCFVPALGLIYGLYLGSPIDDPGYHYYFGLLIMIIMLMFSWTHISNFQVLINAISIISLYLISVLIKSEQTYSTVIAEITTAIFIMLAALSMGILGRLINENHVRQNFIYAQRLKELADEQTYYATHDVLTGLSNLYHTQLLFEHDLATAKESNSMFTVMLLDLNDFKIINDTYSHQTGDEVLKVVSKRFRYCVRNIDHVGRIGGDEFAICLSTDDQSLNFPKKIKDKITKSISKPIRTTDMLLNVGISIGYASYPEDGTDYKTLLSIADKRMYAEKRRLKKDFDRRVF